MNTHFEWNKVKQLSAAGMLEATFIPSIIAFMGFHFVAPLMVANGISKIHSWNYVAIALLLIFVLLAVLLLRREARNLGISIFSRMCFKKISARQWILAAVVMVSSMAVCSLLSSLIAPMLKALHFNIPDYTPFFLNQTINPAGADMSVIDPNTVFKGNYSIIALMAVSLILNILTEELYFRAWMLPKLSKYRKYAWVINGLLFAFYHTFQLWMLPVLLPASLAMAFVFYKTKSIWPSLIGHIIGNFILSLAGVIMLVL